MKKHLLLFIVLASICGQTIQATDLKITNVRALNRAEVLNTPISVMFDIQWNNAWHNQKNHDAVWVFMKYNGYYNNHVKVLPKDYKVLVNRSGEDSQPTIEFSKDGLGFFIYPQKNYRGSMNFKLQILIDTEDKDIDRNKLTGLSVYGLEMVYIPQGPFTLGSPDPAAKERAAFYKSDSNGEPNGLITITSEQAITVAPTEGNLYYWSRNPLYNGDQQGTVPENFPKGYKAFYIMKYELTQGQYVAFLNNLSDTDTFKRAAISGRTYLDNRGAITIIDGIYKTSSPNRPMNYISFTDGLAFSDWAAIRPITELEYEKAARGPNKPIPAEFVWGTNTYNSLERYVDNSGELILANNWDESQLNDDNRAVFGASYYWVMDLSGSLWEKVITIGNPIGREFKGSHGDGSLRFGSATNPDWPTSDNEVGGFGYRGGGYYAIGTPYSDFNPHSPIGYRFYGAWSGGPHSIAYGYRGGRSSR
ncbi:formylglycine-generating enzyme family protein [Hanstruepera marina]|uniref:formylglycine-generating enzyme family protein n=1 Tax=Hanstruepera marina TaxID=2873265 RepID=UPI001CA68951|nr:SUMF1/EgtB/PvdO family nonheme iron enzyme [Hanstruepera marina]